MFHFCRHLEVLEGGPPPPPTIEASEGVKTSNPHPKKLTQATITSFVNYQGKNAQKVTVQEEKNKTKYKKKKKPTGAEIAKNRGYWVELAKQQKMKMTSKEAQNGSERHGLENLSLAKTDGGNEHNPADSITADHARLGRLTFTKNDISSLMRESTLEEINNLVDQT